MILIRRFKRVKGAPISGKVIAKIPYKSGQRELFKQRYGFDPYDHMGWRVFLTNSPYDRRARDDGSPYLYQVYRWGQMSHDEPFNHKNYWNLYPGKKQNGKKRDLRKWGLLPRRI